MRTMLDNVLREPRASDAPQRVWRDWVLVGALFVAIPLELLLRDDVNAPYAAGPVAALLAIILLWRRSHPLATFVAAAGAIATFDVVGVSLGYGPINLGSCVVLVVFLYAAFRWSSGREMAIAAPFTLVFGVLVNALDFTDVGDFIGGLIVLGLIVAVALAVRYRGRFLEQGRQQARVQERERIARDLHDTVAHHMSAIAIQAQAGQFVAESGSLDGAKEALGVIEEEASRTLAEMRSIVGVLRDQHQPVEMAPLHGMTDIESLASNAGSPSVSVALAEGLRGVSDAVGAAAYRIAQESITNARRHARNATMVNVRVESSTDSVHLTVTNDGEHSANPGQHGFGLIGMRERATLLGGTLEAGPTVGGGWTVRATLPRQNAV